jgi:Ca-activated chloride channel family protein
MENAMPRRLIASVLSLLLLAPLAGLCSARADEPPTVIFLLDSSGSMWGKVGSEKRSKYEFTRDALHEVLPRLRPDARAGLAAFGHRRRGNCSDAEVIVPPQTDAAQQIIAPLDTLNATGKGPLVLGLREAATAIGTAAPATIVLIHDDVDNCGQDLCAEAAHIAQSNAHLTVHVIGLGLDRTRLQLMSCLPRLTGGKLFDAHDAAGLAKALDRVMKLAHLDAETATEPAEATIPRDKPAADAAPGLYLSAGLGPDSATLESPLLWRISKGPGGELIKEVRAAKLVERLPPGSYEVDARIGLAEVRETVDVKAAGPTPVRVNLNAGVLKLLARPATGAAPLPAPTFTVTRADDESAIPIWVGRESQPEIVLPAGAYKVMAEDGLARQERSVTIAPATGTTFDAMLATGRLELTATRGSTADQGEPMSDGVTYIVYEDDPDAPLGRREVTRSAAPAPTFTLPARTYYITAHSSGAEAREQIAIGAGDVVKRTLPLALAQLTLSATLDGAPTPQSLPIAFSIVQLDGEPHEVVRTAARDPKLDLSAGHYRIEATLGATNVNAVTDLTLSPGRSQEVALKLEAGHITLKRADREGSGVGDTFWEIKDADQHTVLRTSQPQPTALLAPGRYIVTAETRESPLRASIEVKAGEKRTIEIGG